MVEDNYVYGRIRRISRNGNVIQAQPLFSPDFDQSLTTLIMHRRWDTVVSFAHVSLELHKKYEGIKFVQHEIESIVRGAPRPTQRRQLL